jgi:ankyrin repeat protein
MNFNKNILFAELQQHLNKHNASEIYRIYLDIDSINIEEFNISNIDKYVYYCLKLSKTYLSIQDYLVRFLYHYKLPVALLNEILSFSLLFYKCSIQFLTALIDCGADVNYKDEYNCTPLFYALANRLTTKNIIMLLLTNHAKVKETPNIKLPVLEYYLFHIKTHGIILCRNIISLLIQFGADYKSIDDAKYLINMDMRNQYLECISEYEVSNIKSAIKK